MTRQEYLPEFIKDVEGCISIEMLKQHLYLVSIHFSLSIYIPKGLDKKIFLTDNFNANSILKADCLYSILGNLV